jgi:hypothetical protein
MDYVLAPVMHLEAVGPLSEGILVPWGNVGEAAIVMGGIYPGLLCVAGVFLFRRRDCLHEKNSFA